MDNRITIGDKIDLKKIDTRLSAAPDAKLNLYTSQVLDEAPEDRIYAAMPIRGGTIVPLGVGQQFQATFYTNKGLQQCEVLVTGRTKRGSLFLVELEQITPLKKIQRREYFRYECVRKIKYRVLEGEELRMLQSGNAYLEDEENVIWQDAFMLDLSGGGMRFVSAVNENKKTLIQLCFDIVYNETVEVVYVYAEILRSERNENNKSIYTHRAEFWEIDNGLREKIIQYIFNEQRKQRSQKNN